MKNLSDIRLTVDNLRRAQEMAYENYKEALFKLYDETAEIKVIVSNFENFTGGEYEFEDGELIYEIEVPKTLAVLPEIGPYLTRDYGKFISDRHGARLNQSVGEFIKVGPYDVYDHGAGEKVIDSRVEWMTDEYLRAKVELHMRSKGVFGDVIETDGRGYYYGHFDMKWPDKGEDLDAMTDDELKAIVTRYEEENHD